MPELAEKSNFRRAGVSALALVVILGGLFIVSIAFVSWKFSSADSSQNFFQRTAGLVSGTFKEIFSAGENKPAMEIDLGENREASSSVSVGENKFLSTRALGKSVAGKSNNLNSFSENSDTKSSVNKNSSSSSASVPETTISENSENKKSSSVACNFSVVQSPSHKILFSELAWMGSKENSGDEWLELKNNSGRDLSLASWHILSSDENIKIIFEEKDYLKAGGLFLLERSDDNSAPNVPADKIYSGALANSGVRLKIFSPECELADEIDASKKWPAGDNSAKKTMERSFLDLSWHTSANPGGTPKAENTMAFEISGSVTSMPQSEIPASTIDNNTASTTATGTQNSSAVSSGSQILASRILISEIMAGSNVSSYDEFVELYNAGSQAIDLTGWSIKKRSSTGSESILVAASRLEGLKILPNHYFLAANASATLPLTPDVLWPKSYTLAYTQNAVILYDSGGVKTDEVSWNEIPKDESYVRDSWSSNSFHISAAPTPQNSASQW